MLGFSNIGVYFVLLSMRKSLVSGTIIKNLLECTLQFDKINL